MNKEFTEGFLLTKHFKLNYRIYGEGIPVLVIGSSLYYPRLFSKKLLSLYQFIFLDHKGFGIPIDGGEMVKADYSLETVVEDMEKGREKLGIDTFILLGHSGHAFMAMEYASKFPQRVRKLALLNTAPTNSAERQDKSIACFEQGASPERKRAFRTDFSKLGEDIKKDPANRFKYMNIRMRAHSFYDFTFDPECLWEGVQTNMDVIDYLWGETFAGMNLLESLKTIEKPVFLGLGKYDYLVSPNSLWDEVDHGYPHILKIIFERSGHNPMFEEQELFDKKFIDWVGN